jgi:hypothetical protein
MLNQYLKELRKTEDIDIILDTSEKKTDPTIKKLRPAFPKEIALVFGKISVP